MRIEDYRCLKGLEFQVSPGSEIGWLLIQSVTGDAETINTRESALRLFAEYAESVPGFRVPKTRRVNGKLEVESAPGICVQIRDPNRNLDLIRFFGITTIQKIIALKIYLNAVLAVNQHHELIHDHNPDGIFVDLDLSEQITVWAVDSGDIGKCLHQESEGHYSKDEVFSGLSTGILDLLLFFFNGSLKSYSDCIPDSLRAFAKKNERDSTVSVSDLLAAVSSVNDDEIIKAENERAKILQSLKRRLENPEKDDHQESTYVLWCQRSQDKLIKFFQLIRDKQYNQAANELKELICSWTEFKAEISVHSKQELQFWSDFCRTALSAEFQAFGLKVIKSDSHSVHNITDFYQCLVDVVTDSDYQEWIGRIYSLVLESKF